MEGFDVIAKYSSWAQDPLNAFCTALSKEGEKTSEDTSGTKNVLLCICKTQLDF